MDATWSGDLAGHRDGGVGALRGVDTPETARPKCPEEKALADATNVAGALLAAGHGRPYAGGRRESWRDPS